MLNMTTSLALTLLPHHPLSNSSNLTAMLVNNSDSSGSDHGTDHHSLTTAAVQLLLQELTTLTTSLSEDRLLLPNSTSSLWPDYDDNVTSSSGEEHTFPPGSSSYRSNSLSLITTTTTTTTTTTSDRVPLATYNSPVQKVLVPLVCGMGLVLNVLNLLVLTERCLKESPYAYLTAMALLCLASLSMSLLQDVCMLNFSNNYYCFVYVFHVYFPFVNICSNSTMWLIVTLTIERFLFIKHPLWARAKCDRRSAKIKICVVIVLMVLLNIPRFLFYKVVPCKEKGPGYYTYDYQALLSKEFVVISWIYSVIIQLIPMSILCVLNSYLVYAVHRARRLRKNLQIRNNMEARWSREQTRLTVTLIIIVFVFLVCIVPSAFSDLHVAYAFFGARGQSQRQFSQSRFFKLFGVVTNLLVFCQLSFNFVPFSAFNNKFRAVFKRMLRRWMEQLRRCVSGQRSNRSMRRLMRMDAAVQGLSGCGGARGVEIIGNHHHHHNNNNSNDDRNKGSSISSSSNNKLQLRSSSNSMSSGGSKDTTTTITTTSSSSSFSQTTKSLVALEIGN